MQRRARLAQRPAGSTAVGHGEVTAASLGAAVHVMRAEGVLPEAMSVGPVTDSVLGVKRGISVTTPQFLPEQLGGKPDVHVHRERFIMRK